MQTILLLKSAFLCVFRFFGLSSFDIVTTLILSRLASFLPFFEVIPEILFIFVQINKGKQLFIPLANRGNFIRRLFEPGMAVVSTVLCLDLRIGAGTGTGRFSCSGSLKPALRGTDLRFFAGNKAARSLFRGGVRRCITVGISDEIPVLPSRLDFRGGGCDLGVTDNILPGGFLFLPFVSERRVYRGVTQERSPTGVPSAAPFFRGRADGQYVTTY